MSRDPIHLHPTALLAPRVLLPGDPGRALRLAQQLIEAPRMLNHNRGLWGYSGACKRDGEPLSIQSTGMGGPSAAIVISELIHLGASALIRVGTCGALADGLALGDLVIGVEALAADGASRALGAGERVTADRGLVEALQRAARSRGEGGPAVHAGLVVSSDLFYDPRGLEAEWAAAGALAVEMEAAVLYALAGLRGVRAGCALIVTDLVAARARIDPDALLEAEAGLGELAVGALVSSWPTSG